MNLDEIKEFYSKEGEKDRLELELFKLEGIRTKEIVTRYLSQPSMNIADIGGGAGFYAFWLQEMGHNVTLIDLSSRNIELADERSRKTGLHLTKCAAGDAINLDLADDQFDLVLLFGPLYHLIKKSDRVKALAEAKRIVKPGGVVLAAVISRYASLFDGFKRDLVLDKNFYHMLTHDLESGIHLNKTSNPEFFTTAYFHNISEIKMEVKESGLQFEKLVGVESFGWIVDNFNKKSTDELYMEKLLTYINRVESNDDLIAMSQHIIAVGLKANS